MVNYIDLASFSSYTRTTYDGLSDPTDTQVQSLIDLSCAEVEELTGREWARTDDYAEYISEPSDLIKLSNTPVLNVDSVVDDNLNPVGYTVVNRDFIKLDKQVPVTVTYDYGFDNTPTAIIMLCNLYTLAKIIQGGSSNVGNTESISVGPISITSQIGLSTVINLDLDIAKYERRVRTLIR